MSKRRKRTQRTVVTVEQLPKWSDKFPLSIIKPADTQRDVEELGWYAVWGVTP